MSYDLGVWYPHERLSDGEAGRLYVGLCEGKVQNPKPHPAVDAFYQELTAKHPEMDTVPDDKVDDVDYCPGVLPSTVPPDMSSWGVYGRGRSMSIDS